jgi:hypothetical protein
MKCMFRRSILRCSIVLATLALFAFSSALRAQDDDSHHGRKYKAPPPSSHIEVTILKADNGKPIREAHVVFHPIEGDKDKGSMELKTDEDGKISIDVIPIGDTIRLQVIANGFQTYGQDYKVEKPRMSVEVRMKRPGAQYSIYKNSTANSAPGNAPGSDKSSGNSSDSGKSSGPPAQPDPPPTAGSSPPQSN